MPPKQNQSSDTSQLAEGRSARLYHLDALRSLAMLYGLFVHAAELYDVQPFPVVGLISIHFRMATFFLVSGYLAALAAVRTGNGAMLRGRTLMLLLPFAVMLVLVAPFTNYLVFVWNEGPELSFLAFQAQYWDPEQFLHLWFLPVLWVYVILVPTMRHVLGFSPLRRSAAVLAQWHPDAIIVVLALATAVAAVALRGLYPTVVRPVFSYHFAWYFNEMLRYLPFFALGVALQASRPLFDRFHRVSLPALALGAVFAIAAGRLDAGLSTTGNTAVWLFVWGTLTLPIVAALLRVSLSLFSAPNPIVTALTGSMYTVYLFHYAAIFMFAFLLAPLIGKGVALYFGTVALTFAATFALDRLVISRVPLLRLLFNGRLPGPPKGRGVAPRSGGAEVPPDLDIRS